MYPSVLCHPTWSASHSVLCVCNQRSTWNSPHGRFEGSVRVATRSPLYSEVERTDSLDPENGVREPKVRDYPGTLSAFLLLPPSSVTMLISLSGMAKVAFFWASIWKSITFDFFLFRCRQYSPHSIFTSSRHRSYSSSPCSLLSSLPHCLTACWAKVNFIEVSYIIFIPLLSHYLILLNIIMLSLCLSLASHPFIIIYPSISVFIWIPWYYLSEVMKASTSASTTIVRHLRRTMSGRINQIRRSMGLTRSWYRWT